MLVEWRDIPGYESSYQVSNDGQLRSLDRNVPHARYGTQFIAGCTISLSPNTMGRLQVHIKNNDGIKTHPQIHQLVMLAFVGPPPEGMEVCHNNGDHTDNRLENLRYDTHAANMMDRRVHGTLPWKDQCRNGHPRTPENLRETRGVRYCVPCKKVAWTKTNARLGAERAAARANK